jgi:hypothetical protein
MKNTIKLVTVILAFAALLLGAAQGQAQSTVGINPGASWLGYMNVFNITGAPGYGSAAAGAFQFGGAWGTADLTATWSGSTLTLGPNTIGDPNAYWYTPAGGPGSVGNKIMDANFYVDTTGVYSGTTLTFTGDVLSDTLANGPVNANGEGWTSVAFIKDFAPDYSSFNIVTAPLVNGVFSISMATINDPTRHVQYGFETIGPDVWATDVAPFGTVVIAPVPEPSTLAMSVLGGVGMLSWLQRRKK